MANISNCNIDNMPRKENDKYDFHFWDKVEKCLHKNISPDYCEDVNCGTPYCTGSETHCLDCGVFISQCHCGVCNGMDGWSWRRRSRYYRNKSKK